MADKTAEALFKELEDMIGKAKIAPIEFTTIDPRKDYNADEFRSAYGRFLPIAKSYGLIRQNPFDLDARKEASRALHGMEDFHVNVSPIDVQVTITNAYRHGAYETSVYAHKNRNEFLNLQGTALRRLVDRLQMYKTKKDTAEGRVHDIFVDLINDVRDMTKVIADKDFDKMRARELKNASDPSVQQWGRESIKELRTSDNFMKQLYIMEAGRMYKGLNTHLTHNNAPHTEMLKGLLNTTLDVGLGEWRKVNDEKEEKSEKEARRIWVASIMPHYLRIADEKYHELTGEPATDAESPGMDFAGVFGQEKESDDTLDEKTLKRREQRKGRGMPF